MAAAGAATAAARPAEPLWTDCAPESVASAEDGLVAAGVTTGSVVCVISSGVRELADVLAGEGDEEPVLVSGRSGRVFRRDLVAGVSSLVGVEMSAGVRSDVLPRPGAVGEGVDAEPLDASPRLPERAGPDWGADRLVVRVAGPFEEASFEPVEPAEPVVSAKATDGIAATAAPTPKATASAPTRPT